VADEYLGERSLAYVILRAGAEPLKPVAIKRFVRERGVAAYKVPDLVEFVGAFPHTGVGKVSKQRLRSTAVNPEQK
jgi:2,3-dihydroxybenzoate-AMP ligase